MFEQDEGALRRGHVRPGTVIESLARGRNGALGVDGGGGLASLVDGVDNQRGAAGGVAGGEDALLAGHRVADPDVAASVEREAQLLDEATSQLDAESEVLVQQAGSRIGDLMEERPMRTPLR